MSLVSRMMARDSSSLSSPTEWLSNMFSQTSIADVNVTLKRAFEHTTVYDCVNILREFVASLLLFLYKSEMKNG